VLWECKFQQLPPECKSTKLHKIKIQHIFWKSKLWYYSATKLQCFTVIDNSYHKKTIATIVLCKLLLSNVCLHCNGHFSRWIWVSRYQNVLILDLVGAKDDGDGGDNWSCKSAKLIFFHQQTNTQLSTGRMSAVLSMLQLLLQHFGDFSISVGICNTFFTVSIAKNTGGQKAS